MPVLDYATINRFMRTQQHEIVRNMRIADRAAVIRKYINEEEGMKPILAEVNRIRQKREKDNFNHLREQTAAVYGPEVTYDWAKAENVPTGRYRQTIMGRGEYLEMKEKARMREEGIDLKAVQERIINPKGN